MNNSPSLPETVRRLMLDKRNTIVVSAASAWEMATKVRLGRLPADSDTTRNFERVCFRGLSEIHLIGC